MKKTMRNFAIAFLAVICFTCLAFAVACGEKKYYTVTFIYDEGVVIESEVKSGAQVKEGYEVSFTLSIAENAFGDPAVTVNEAVVNADANGVYTFKVKEDTVVEITGVSLLADYKIEFGTEVEVEVSDGLGGTVTRNVIVDSPWVRFTNLAGEPLKELTASSGETISFKVDVSVYYDGYDYTVAAGSSILHPDENGVYTYSVIGEQTVAVKGLPDDEEVASGTFLGRTVLDANGNEVNEGMGTQSYPYKIRKPIDLYYLANQLGSETHPELTYSYFTLEEDIDMKGEQLYVIGKMLDENSTSFFGGTFDGQGHTIKNYYITDTYTNYSTGIEEHTNYVGLFGCVQPTTYGGAGIYNLNLENFTVMANGAAQGTPVFAGGLVGYGVGVNISNCNVQGTVIADGDRGYFGYVGGIIGLQQSAYLSDNTRIYSVIQSCSSNVEVNCDSGYILAAGGITGYQISGEERTTAAILNCYSTGNVSGAMRTGGITGIAGSYSSIKNCYATGSVIARSKITTDNSEYRLAYAGGIAGYAQYGSILSNSYFTGTVNSRSTAGGNYALQDGVVSGTDAAGTQLIHTDGTVVYKCYSTAKTAYGTASSINDSFIQDTLGWASADWTFKGNGTPEINQLSANKSFTVLVSVDGVNKARLDVTDTYIPVSYWYYEAEITEGENKLPEFIGTGAARTYGYYFDEACTIKVPFGFIPTDNITLFAKYVDYTDVTGTYYISGDEHFTLTEDGFIRYRNGALWCDSTYVYNGDYLILQNMYGVALNEDGTGEIVFNTFKADKTETGLNIYSYDESYTAVKKLDSFNYGTYYGTDGTQYTFNEDGTGVWNGTEITYTVSETEITLFRDGNEYLTPVELTDGKFETLGGVSVTLYHPFKGEWEGSVNSSTVYSFDGKGGWTSANGSGSYTYENGTISFDGKTAVYEDGFIKIKDGETLFLKNSFVGTWVYSAEYPVQITLNGIGTEGYGTAVIDYSSGGVYKDLNYTASVEGGEIYLEIFNHYELFAALRYNAEDKTLIAEYLLVLYDLKADEIKSGVRFCVYDEFKGVWSGHSADESDVISVEFNGYGRYDLGSIGDALFQRGEITLTVGKSKFKQFVVYLNEDGTLIGTPVTIGGKSCTLTYNADGTLTVVYDGKTYTLDKNQ